MLKGLEIIEKIVSLKHITIKGNEVRAQSQHAYF